MKTSLVIIIMLNVTMAFSQDNVLADFKYKSFIVDNSFKNSCIISDSIIDDKWELIILSQGECNAISGFVNFVRDTIDLSFRVPCVIDTQYLKYDSISGQSFNIVEIVSSSMNCCNGFCGYELTYVLDRKYENKKIRINNEFLIKCKNYFDYVVIKGDTVNMTDKFGLKQGDWLDHYPNQKIKKREHYINSRLIHGIGYDEQGEIISRTTRNGEMTITIEDK